MEQTKENISKLMLETVSISKNNRLRKNIAEQHTVNFNVLEYLGLADARTRRD